MLRERERHWPGRHRIGVRGTLYETNPLHFVLANTQKWALAISSLLGDRGFSKLRQIDDFCRDRQLWMW